MFDVGSQESQAHHQFMAMSPDQRKVIDNHELFGNAAAYHAVAKYTDHIDEKGEPESEEEAQKMILGYAQEFVDHHVDNNKVAVEKQKAVDEASATLKKSFPRPSIGCDGVFPRDYRLKYATPNKSFDNWASAAKKDVFVQGGGVWNGHYYGN